MLLYVPIVEQELLTLPGVSELPPIFSFLCKDGLKILF